MLHMVLLQIESGTIAPNIIKAFFSSRSQPQTLTTDSLVRYQSDLRKPYLHLRSGEPTNGEVWGILRGWERGSSDLADDTRSVEGYASRGSYWMRKREWLFQCCVQIPKFWLKISVGVAHCGIVENIFTSFFKTWSSIARLMSIRA